MRAIICRYRNSGRSFARTRSLSRTAATGLALSALTFALSGCGAGNGAKSGGQNPNLTFGILWRGVSTGSATGYSVAVPRAAQSVRVEFEGPSQSTSFFETVNRPTSLVSADTAQTYTSARTIDLSGTTGNSLGFRVGTAKLKLTFFAGQDGTGGEVAETTQQTVSIRPDGDQKGVPLDSGGAVALFSADQHRIDQISVPGNQVFPVKVPSALQVAASYTTDNATIAVSPAAYSVTAKDPSYSLQQQQLPTDAAGQTHPVVIGTAIANPVPVSASLEVGNTLKRENGSTTVLPISVDTPASATIGITQSISVASTDPTASAGRTAGIPMHVGDSRQFTAAVLPAGLSSSRVIWRVLSAPAGAGALSSIDPQTGVFKPTVSGSYVIQGFSVLETNALTPSDYTIFAAYLNGPTDANALALNNALPALKITDANTLTVTVEPIFLTALTQSGTNILAQGTGFAFTGNAMPASAPLLPKQATFAASVDDFSAVSWSVQEANGGTIDAASGNYTAPTNPGTFHIIGTVAGGKATITITITINAATVTATVG